MKKACWWDNGQYWGLIPTVYIQYVEQKVKPRQLEVISEDASDWWCLCEQAWAMKQRLA